MANVKISPAPPIGLPAAATLTGAELIPMDQTIGGVTTTVKGAVSAIIGLVPVGVSSFNTRTGAVTLTSSDVTTALGYAPLSSFNGRTGPAITLTSADVTTALGFTPPTGLANPSALVGLTAINGTATTAMRSDGAPAIDQGITPTWTHTHTFTGAGTGIGISFHNAVGIAWQDTGGGQNVELQLFSDNQVYLDNHSVGSPGINLRVGSGFSGLHINLFGVQLDAPQTVGGDTLSVTANADLTGVLINGAANNIGLSISNSQSGAVGSWRLMSSATGSGFGAGNLVLGRNSSAYTTWSSSGSMTVNSPSTVSDTVISNNAQGHAAFLASLSASSGYGLFVSANGTGSYGLYYSQTAGNAVNAIHLSQAGQSTWDIFQAGGSDDLQFYNGAVVPLRIGNNGANIIGGFNIANASGSTYGGQWSASNTSSGATNTNKTWRINPTGGLELINSAFTAAIFSIADNANAALGSGGFTINGGAGSASILSPGGGGLTFDTPAATQVNALTLNQSGSQQWILYQPASDNTLRLYASGDQVTFVNSGTGRVGIGTFPDSILHVLGVSGSASFRVGYNGTSVNYSDADTQHWRNGSAVDQMILTAGSLAVTPFISVGGKWVNYSNDATGAGGGKISSQSGGTASGGNPGDIILIY